MSKADKLSMSRFIFQYLMPLFTAALILVLLSYLGDVRAAAANANADAGENYTAAVDAVQTEYSVFCD